MFFLPFSLDLSDKRTILRKKILEIRKVWPMTTNIQKILQKIKCYAKNWKQGSNTLNSTMRLN